MRPIARRFALPVIFLLGVALASTAQGRRPLSFDDLMALGRVSDPQISPEGRWVVYVVDHYDKATNGRTSDLWLVPLADDPTSPPSTSLASTALRVNGASATSEPRQLTRSGKRDRRPRWSPDGSRLAFLSNRDGRWQMWTIVLEGGEATKLTDLPVDVGGLLWSPDGRWLAFTAEVYPDCPAEDALACTAKRDEEKEKSKVKARLYDALLYRHWNTWSEGKRSHVFILAADGSPEASGRDLTPGDFNVPPFSLGGPDDYAFSPDSRELCFARNTDPDRALSTNSDLWLLPVTGGPSTALPSTALRVNGASGTSEPKKITTNPAWDGSPLYSPDGRWIAFRAQARAGFEADRFRLQLYERATGKIISLTEKFDHWVDEFVWAPDSRTIYFTAPVHAQAPIFAVSVPAGRVREIVGASSNAGLGLSRDGRTFVFTRQSLSAPTEVWQANVADGRAKPLTRTNQAIVSRVEWSAVEEFHFAGAGGRPVQGWLLKPPGFDPQKKYPALFMVHGGPQSVWANTFHYRWNAQLFAAPGYVVALLNPRGSVGWGQKFIDEISGDWGGKVYEDLVKGLDYLSALPYVDAERICAAGGSYGGYMVNWLAGHTARFRCLISHAGVFNLTSMYGSTEELWFPEWEFRGTPWTNAESYAQWSPHRYVANFRTPTLVIHGARDYRVPLAEGLQLFTSLQRQKVPSKFLYFPDEGHWIGKPQNSELWYKTFHDWLAHYLKMPDDK
ncbi:MAG: S9 family peptidase [Terriglobia bacterium]